jgi:hypothetical protein
MPIFTKKIGIFFSFSRGESSCKSFRMMKKIHLSFVFLLFVKLAVAQTKGQTSDVKNTRMDSLTKISSVAKTLATEMGYRVQVFYGLDRREAFNEQNRFKSLYPNLRSYITYKEPNYYLRVGDFKTRLEAQDLLTELRPNFPTLFIFREKINLPEVDSIKP